MFSNFYYYAYIPVTLLSHAADVAVWGLKPWGHHLTNVLLHTANAVWVLLLGVQLFRSAARRAPLVIGMSVSALLFALHPLRAESVSWISDRKDLLCAFFFLPGLIAYLRYASGRKGREGIGWYLASFLLFLLAALSKSIAVIFPALLLLLDWLWIRDRTGSHARLALEKVPFVLVAAILAVLSLGESPDAKRAYAVAHLTGAEALLYPFHSLTFALQKTLLPLDLSPIYPRVGMEAMLLGMVLAVAITAISVVLAIRGKRGALLAWLAYLLPLLPNVPGLSSGMQPVADRYAYLSTIPLFLLLGGALSAAWGRFQGMRRVALAGSCAALLVLSARATVAQAARWKSSISLWQAVVAGSPPTRDYVDAYLNLGAAFVEAERPVEARSTFEKAAAIDPTNAEVAYNLGILTYVEGNREGALALFAKAARDDPRHARAFFNLAIVCDELGRGDEALAAMVQAARLGYPDAQDALNSRGIPW